MDCPGLARKRRRLRALVRAELLVDASPVRIGDPATATLISLDVPQNCREKSRHLRLQNDIASPHLPARDQIRGPFGDRNDGRVRVAPDDRRHHRRIDHAQPFDALNVQSGIHHRADAA